MSPEISYISASANQTPHIAHWGKNKLICYGSSNAVLIYDLQIGGGKVTHTLHIHNKRVNAVKWIGGCDYEAELVSVGTDSKVVVWSCNKDKYVGNVLLGHEGIVNIVDARYREPDKKETIVVTASDDSTARVWIRLNQTGEFALHQTINFGYNICIGLRFTLIPGCNNYLMACALDKSTIELFIESENTFQKKTSLKEHEDWVRGLDFTIDENRNILLASCSQDTVVRIWKFIPKNDVKEDDKIIESISTPTNIFCIKTESVLAGHEGWVYSVNWSKNNCLLSASLDKMMIIWKLQKDMDLWLDSDKVGEVGGNTLGFYGGMFSPDGNSILAHSYHGAFHIWSYNGTNWEPQVTVGGHFGEVVDLCWDPFGEYVMSVSYDQTTRIHAPWRKSEHLPVSWHEIARPQVHGYDMSCMAILGRYKFASGAEEKIIRTFQAPENFVQNFRRVCRIIEDNVEYNAPKGASVPSLGLSNKAVYENDNLNEVNSKNNKDPYPEESHFTAVDLIEPPTEETLIQNTLWPEIQKLYGHGYELYAMAASPDGKLLASACKATTPEHAAIILWETENWQILQKLPSHTLTITQISFSPDCNHILSVSRDRRWSLFTRESNKYELVATTDRKTGVHARIIWCCAWTHDSKYFATGSRDSKIVLWRKNDDKVKENCLGQYETAADALIIQNESITALAFSPGLVSGKYFMAAGLEIGTIHLYLYEQSINEFRIINALNTSIAHHLTVKRIVFRPIFGCAGSDKNNDNDVLQFASCSSDHSVRIFDVDVSQL